MQTLIAPTINLLILIGILAYYLRRPLKNFVHQRHLTIAEDLRVAAAQLKGARTRYSEFSAKLSSLGQEAEELRKQAKMDAQAMKERITAEAKRLSTDVARDARASAESLYSDLKRQLYSDLSSRVLARSEALLRDRLTGDDRVRIQKEFSRQLETTAQ